MLMVMMRLFNCLLHELRNTVSVDGRDLSLVVMHVFGSRVRCTPMPVQLVTVFRLRGMVIPLLPMRTIPAVGLVRIPVNRLGLLCCVILQLTLFRVSGRNGRARANVSGENMSTAAPFSLRAPHMEHTCHIHAAYTLHTCPTHPSHTPLTCWTARYRQLL